MDESRDRAARPTPAPPWARVGGVALAVAFLGSAALVMHETTGIGLPGCGIGSPCARAATSRWGSIPILAWPTSTVGAAFFAGMLAAWVATGGRLGRAGMTLARLGVAASVFFLVIAIGERLWCPYCLLVHGACLGAWFAAERSHAAAPASSGRALPAFVLGLLACVAATLGVRAVARASAAARTERSLQSSAARLREGAPAGVPSFSGRYRAGPADAPVSLVVFTDYQCPDCALLDRSIDDLLAARRDVSVTVMHFPFCTDCNPRAGRTLHPNACWAARAAEAAGALSGADGFWRMHRWLFSRSGAFTDAELRDALPGLGFDPGGFIAEMTSDRTLAAVRADIDRAFGVGLALTPMLFVNGVELRAWNAPDALGRAADAAAHAPPAPPAPPPPALAKLVADWLDQPRSHIPPALPARLRGAATASVRVVLFGDYQEPNCAQADALLRGLTGARRDASYEFRHFPMNPACNPVAREALHPMACRMAAAAEAAAIAGGDAAFWAAHEYIFSHQRTYDDLGLLGALRPLGVNIASLPRASDTPEVRSRILADCRSAEAVGIIGVPLIFVNERRVPRWTYEDLPVMEAILDRAAHAE